jgi:hypothetical protein
MAILKNAIKFSMGIFGWFGFFNISYVGSMSPVRGYSVISAWPSWLCTLNLRKVSMDRRIFDYFLYHDEAYMLYVGLFTLAPVINRFVIGHANQSFTR